MRDVLCVYYSRSGNTKKVMKSIAAELNAELVQLTDGVERGGLRGWFRCGLDAVKRDCRQRGPLKRSGGWKITGWSLSEPRCGQAGAAAWYAAS